MNNDNAPVTPTPPPADPPVPSEKSDVQNRIDALYGQRKQAEEMAAQVTKENLELKARLLAAEERLSTQTRVNNSSQTGGVVPDSHASGAPAPVDSELADIRKQLAAVNEALSRKSLEEKQLQSLNSARQFIPGLAAGDGELIKAATEILARDPMLAKHPQGPMLAAALAASLRSPGTNKPADRAGVFTPASNANAALDAGAAQKQIEGLEKELAEVTEKMRGSGGSEFWPKYKSLQVKLGELKKSKG